MESQNFFDEKYLEDQQLIPSQIFPIVPDLYNNQLFDQQYIPPPVPQLNGFIYSIIELISFRIRFFLSHLLVYRGTIYIPT